MQIEPLNVFVVLIAISIAGGIFCAIFLPYREQNSGRREFLDHGIRVTGEILSYDYMFGCAPYAIHFKFKKNDSKEWIIAYSPLNGFPMFGPEYFPVGMSVEVIYLEKFPKIAVPTLLLNWCVGSGPPSDRAFRKVVRALEKDAETRQRANK